MKTDESGPVSILYLVLRPLALFLASVLMSGTCILAQPSTASSALSSSSNFRQIESSPRITVLRERLEAADKGALEKFWFDVARTGTPLIEPAKGNSNQVVVTFLWRGDAKTESVGLLAPLQSAAGMPNFPLRRLLNTDVWYKCWQLRDDLRFTYRFLPEAKLGSKECAATSHD